MNIVVSNSDNRKRLEDVWKTNSRLLSQDFLLPTLGQPATNLLTATNPLTQSKKSSDFALVQSSLFVDYTPPPLRQVILVGIYSGALYSADGLSIVFPTMCHPDGLGVVGDGVGSGYGEENTPYYWNQRTKLECSQDQDAYALLSPVEQSILSDIRIREITDSLFIPIQNAFNNRMMSEPSNGLDAQFVEDWIKTNILGVLVFDKLKNTLSWEFHTRSLPLATLFDEYIYGWLLNTEPHTEDKKNCLQSPLRKWLKPKNMAVGYCVPVVPGASDRSLNKIYRLCSVSGPNHNLAAVQSTTTPPAFSGFTLPSPTRTPKMGFNHGSTINLRKLSWSKMPETTPHKEILGYGVPRIFEYNETNENYPQTVITRCNKPRLLEVINHIASEKKKDKTKENEQATTQ